MSKPVKVTDGNFNTEVLSADKKVKDGVVRFILAKKIGDVFITSEVPQEKIKLVLEELGAK